MKITIDASGRIQLPPALQVGLGVKPGDDVVLEHRDGEWIIRSTEEVGGLQWVGNVLVHRGTSTDAGKIEDLINDLRDERFRQVTGNSPSWL